MLPRHLAGCLILKLVLVATQDNISSDRESYPTSIEIEDESAGLEISSDILVEAQTSTQSPVERAMSKISSKMSSLGMNVEEELSIIRKALNSNNDPDISNDVSTSIVTMGEAVGPVTSSNTLNIISSVLDMVSIAGLLVPKVGEAVMAVFGLAAKIFGEIGGKFDTASIVKNAIEAALKTYDEDELRSEAEGVMRVYSVSRAYLKASHSGYSVNQHEYCMLASNIPVTLGDNFLGKLEYKIKKYSSLKDEASVKRAAVYINIYVSLAVLRTSLLFELYSIIRQDSDNKWTAAAIENTINAKHSNDMNVLDFLVNPVYSKAVFYAFYRPSNWPIVTKFLAKIGKNYQGLEFSSNQPMEIFIGSGSIAMFDNVIPLPRRYVELTNYCFSSSCSFYFDAASADDNIFYIRSAKWPSEYFIWSNIFGGMGWDSPPGPNGQWKLTKFGDKYMISNIEAPSLFLSIRLTQSIDNTESNSYSLERQELNSDVHALWIIM